MDFLVGAKKLKTNNQITCLDTSEDIGHWIEIPNSDCDAKAKTPNPRSPN